ncbi:MAG: hypothetical protein K1X89_31420, partial [Myxococcaceae bacterium]|nr:hypothetical protein [Myxococcaceae bacterium]
EARADATTLAQTLETDGREATVAQLQELVAAHPERARGLLLAARDTIANLIDRSSLVSRFDLTNPPSTPEEQQHILTELGELHASLNGPAGDALTDAIALGPTVPPFTTSLYPATAPQIASRISDNLQALGGAQSPFARALAGAYARNGDYVSAKVVQDGITALAAEPLAQVVEAREAFTDAKKETDVLDEQLGFFVQQYGPGLTQDQLLQAIDAFKEEHHDAYAALDEAATQLAQSLQTATDALGPLTPGVPLPVQLTLGFAVLPELGQTPAGQDALAAALIDQGQGKPTFLDAAQTFAASPPALIVGDAATYRQDLGEALVRAAGVGVSATRGTPEQRAVLEGLQRNASVLGLSPSELRPVTDGLEEIAAARTHEQASLAIEGFSRTLDGLGALRAETALGQLFRGLGVGLLAVGNARYQPKNVRDQVTLAASQLQVATGGGELVLGLATHEVAEGSRLFNLARGLGAETAGLNVVLGVVDGINAVDAFRSGENLEGAAFSFKSAGALTLGVAGILTATGIGAEAIPGVGTVIGTGLIITGLVIGLFAADHEAEEEREEAISEAEEEGQRFLEGAGLSEGTAKALSQLDGEGHGRGPAVAAAAEQLGVTPHDIYRYLERVSPEDAEIFLVEAGKASNPVLLADIRLEAQEYLKQVYTYEV